MAVGSLQKPWVAQAWAQSHPGAPSPRFPCAPGSGCWLRSGHGELGLTKALAVSCNTYFLALARATPLPDLASALGAAGFAPVPPTPEDAIGLKGTLAIQPSALLASYRNLLLEPWAVGEPVRREVLDGLRDCALTGTASGLAHRGFWAKTGTVPAPDGDPRRTCGVCLAMDDTGWVLLGRLRPGTGRETASALAFPLDRLRPDATRRSGFAPRATPPSALPATVRVRMFQLLPHRRFQVRNLGPEPAPMGPGFLGPGSTRELLPGAPAGPGLLELTAPGLKRRLYGSVALTASGILATVPLREYVSGVLAGELPEDAPGLRVALGAAVLRFLARGPRHNGAEVCDATHCAYFVGRGPRLRWSRADHAEELPEAAPVLGDADWAASQELARLPGPDQWTGHCGGQPLSPMALWGSGSSLAPPCPRHPAAADPWVRTWSSQALAKAFGAEVERMAAGLEAGVWTLTLWQNGAPRRLRYDEAHRLVAAVLGWDALPSPADQVESTPGGFRLRGHGHGHRVGLCLGQ